MKTRARDSRDIQGLTRRDLLKGSLTVGAALSAEPLLAPRALSAQPRRGGVLRVRGYDPPHFDPHLTLNFKTNNTLSFVYSKLVRHKVGAGVVPGTFAVEPDLAERWEEPDDTTVVFHLRRGVKWQNKPPVNGRELTAEDVKFTYDRFLTEKGNPLRYMLDPVDRVEVVDRYTVTVGFGAVLIANGLAAAIGVTSGYFGGKYDVCVQRVVDACQSFPFLVVILFVMAVLGPGLLNVVLALGVLGAANASRVIRGATISVAQNVYVESARALGAGHLRIMLRHILPNVVATLIVLATIGLGAFILAESALSFLGFGVPPPYPSWGAMLAGSGRSFFYQAPWMAIYPGLAISLAVFGFNMLGDALRDVLDPRLRGASGRLR